MIKSAVIRRIASVSCAAILAAVLCFSSSAADSTEHEYKSTVYFWNLASPLEEYGGTVDGVLISGATGRVTGGSLTDGTFSVPLNLNESLNHLYYGAYYPTTLSGNEYDNSATFKMVVTITTGATGSYTGSVGSLFASTYKGTQIRRTGRVQVSSSGTLETGSGSTYTFTYDNIPYDKVQGYSLFFLDFSLSSFTSLDSSSLYIVNSYFGLSSYYEDDVYKAATMEKLDDINQTLQEQNNKLDNIAGAVDGVGDKVDDAADQISGDLDELQEAIVTQAEKEKEMAEEENNQSKLTVDQALDDAGISPMQDPMFQGVQLLFNTISSTETVNYIPIPEIAIPSLTVSGSQTPEVVLFQETDYDISEILNSKPIQTLIGVAKVMYYIWFFYFMIGYGREVLNIIFGGTNIALQQTDNVVKK